MSSAHRPLAKMLCMRDELAQLRAEDVTYSIAAIGDNFKRAELAQLRVHSDFKLVTMIHPTATCLRGTRIGAGTVILKSGSA